METHCDGRSHPTSVRERTGEPTKCLADAQLTTRPSIALCAMANRCGRKSRSTFRKSHRVVYAFCVLALRSTSKGKTDGG